MGDTLVLNDGVQPKGEKVLANPMEDAWKGATAMMMKGKYDKADAVDPNFLNHSSWYAITGWKAPYPGEASMLPPGPFVKAARDYRANPAFTRVIIVVIKGSYPAPSREGFRT